MKKALCALLLLPSFAEAESPLPPPVCSQIPHMMNYQWETAVYMASTEDYTTDKLDCEKYTHEFQPIIQQYHDLLVRCESGEELNSSVIDIPAFSPHGAYFACNGTNLPALVKPFLEQN